MAEQSKIQWTDSTINFWEGCTKASAGCANCYAEARDKRFTGGKLWGKGAPRRKSKGAVKDALRMNKQPWVCDACGGARSTEPNGGVAFRDGKPYGACVKCDYEWATFHRRRIFSLSLGDWLDDEVPIEWLAEMLDTIRRCDQVEWILCTKRPQGFCDRIGRASAWMAEDGGTDWLLNWGRGNPPANITLLASVENQEQADKRIPQLLAIPAARRGLSLEPLLGPVDLRFPKLSSGQAYNTSLDWLIIGGESGPHARPCNVDWIRLLVQQGQAAGVATFVKQLGANPRLENGAAEWPFRDKKGADPAEWPKALRVQEWPL